MTGCAFEIGKAQIRLEGFEPRRASELKSQAAKLSLVDDALQYEEVKNAYVDALLPRPDGSMRGGVFTEQGRPVPFAQTVRSDLGVVVGRDMGPRAEKPGRLDEAVFGGVLFSGYGHIITETISRLWSAALWHPLPVLFLTHLRPEKTVAGRGLLDEIAGLCGIDTSRIVFLTDAVVVGRLIVPEPGLQLGLSTNNQHLRFLRDAARGSDPAGQADGAVYISRSKLPEVMRKPLGEAEFEKLLASLAFDTIWPEQISISRQIELFNSYKTYVSFIGSQMHTLLFRSEDKAADCVVLCSANPNINFLQIDSTIPGNRIYSVCADYRPVFEFGNRAPFRIDYTAAFSALEAIGYGFSQPRRAVDDTDIYIYKWGHALFHHKFFRRREIGVKADGLASSNEDFIMAMQNVVNRLKKVPDAAKLSLPLLKAFDEVSASFRATSVPVVSQARTILMDLNPSL